MIAEHPDFELIAKPELNILNYRYVPARVQAMLAKASAEKQLQINVVLDQVTKRLQKQQRAAGKTFVSRTRFSVFRYSRTPINVFRVIMANPMTTIATLESILLEQSELAKGERTQALLTSIYKLDDA